METAPALGLGEPELPIGMPEGEIVKAAHSGKEEPVKGSVFENLNAAQFAVCSFISDNVRKAYDIKISFENLRRSRKSSATRSSAPLTSSGRSISTRWTASATASACGRTASAIRSLNTRPRPTRSSKN